MKNDLALLDHLVKLLDWEDAHVAFDRAAKDFPVALRGKRPRQLPYSGWELLEHVRITQADIVDFSENPAYQHREWPAAYWPDSAAPPGARSWSTALKALREDRERFIAILQRNSKRLLEPIPHGTGQTLFREALLLADHTAYHTGQMIVVRRLLGCWE